MNLPDIIHIYSGSVDMRKGLHGLLILVEAEFNLSSLKEEMFLFSNRTRNLVKGVYWDRTGYCILSKKLENSRFKIPKKGSHQEVDRESLRLIMDGIAIFND